MKFQRLASKDSENLKYLQKEKKGRIFRRVENYELALEMQEI